ncbi:dipeptidyl-peptidase-like protein V precursor [Amylocarpus encephaloides]|uniref:Dipeptidyl-peptidase V n=1 Tax=Amylocarpus encephaloides TaxID=45428 RepID=A0A9P7YMI2_9HELO|nr:dipeptidyl-peptidase-like protein V precursor [Amylocarpus encephaloides]
MTVGARRFTPEVLLSAPRRSAATPSPDGTAALFTVTAYSFQTQKKTSEIRVLDIKTGRTKLLVNDAAASEPTWLGFDSCVAWLKGAEKGTTELYSVSLDFPDDKPQLLKTFPGSVSNLKVAAIDSDTIAVAVTGLATPNGKLYNSEMAEKPKSTGRVYSKLFVRQWDAYITENKSSIFYTTVSKSPGIKKLSATPLHNALAGQAVSLESPVPPFGGSGDFDISKNGLAFVAKDPKLDPANHTKTDLYYIPLRTFTETRSPPPLIINAGNLKGYSASPVFSPNAKSVAFTRMKSDQYESDKPRLLLLPDITDLSNVQEFYETKDGEGKWDLRPESIAWSKDGEELYVTAEENGRGKLFKLPASPRLANDLPEALTDDGTVSDFKVLPNNELFLSSTSLVDNSIYSILDPKNPKKKVIVSSNSKGGKTFGLSQGQVDEFWYQGAEDYSVHAWVVKPSFFKKGEKYPLAYLIHGGPQGAWNESWSTRWNPAVFAEQGYVVVTPNPTGSTGYGMAFQNGIRDHWGGRPYLDLVKGFEYIEQNLPYVDTSRAVALGASYGGYMVNWIQGHPLGRKFQALVTHDGVFSTLNQYASEELFFPHHDFGGTLWDARENYEKWDPAAHLKNWATPHFIIHNELDYRLPISEGLAPFNVLQTKGIPSKFLTFPDENHWVLKPENSLVWHREVLGWINKYSGIVDQQSDLEKSIEGIVI